MKTFLALVTTAFATTASAQDISGIWQTEPGDTGGFLHVSIQPCGDKICGQITRAFEKNLNVVDGYEHGGKPIIWDMAQDGDGKWSGGKIWAPDRDKTYNSKMELSGADLKVSGCLLVVCRSQTWRKVQ